MSTVQVPVKHHLNVGNVGIHGMNRGRKGEADLTESYATFLHAIFSKLKPWCNPKAGLQPLCSSTEVSLPVGGFGRELWGALEAAPKELKDAMPFRKPLRLIST